MNDCIQNSDQPISNPTLPSNSKVQGLLRSSSASSSSSFDSCSDLLGSLEHAEESLDVSVKLVNAEHQENESKSVVEDSVPCHQTLQSEDVSGSVALNQYLLTTKEQELLSLIPLEVKDDDGKLEVLSMKDHVYGLKTKVRSLAENTVGRISQLQSSFHLPTSYIFPLKHVVPVFTTPLPTEADAKTDAQIEASNSFEAPTVEGTGTLGEGFDITERACLTDTSSLLPKELGNAEHLQCGDLIDKSFLGMLSDDTRTEGFSSQEVVGVMEQISKMDCMFAGDSVPVDGTNDGSINDGFGNTSTFAGDSLSVMSTNNVSTKDTVGDSSVFAGESTPVVGTNDVTTNDPLVNKDMYLGDSVHTNCVSTKDTFRNNSMLVGDSMPAGGTSDMSTIDVFSNDSRLAGKLKPVTGANDIFFDTNEDTELAEVKKKSFSDSDFKGLGCQKSQNSEQFRTFSQYSDLDVAAAREVLQNASGVDSVIQDGLCLPDCTKQVPGGDSDLQKLEKLIMSFDSRKKNSAVCCHPLRTLSSGSGRPDLEEVEDEQGIALGNKQSFDWNSASTKSGMLSKGQPFELFESASNPADTSLSLESHTRVDHEAYRPKGKEWSSSPETCIPKGNQSSSSFGEQRVQVVGSSALSMNEAEALEGLESGCKQNSLLEVPSCGEILHEERWKRLSIRLESDTCSVKREDKQDLGPDELFRFVENLELNETYVDTVLDMEDVLLNYDENGSRERFLLASSNSVIGTPRSSRDGSLSSSTSGLQLLTAGECTPFTVDWVEVVGAKQRKGGSSFGERIVGVKDHTVYCIKVSSGSQEWEVSRRYRDFVDLYHQLRRKFNVRTEKSLPSPWKEVDRDSRKVFGSTHPNVIEVRSSRIEKCLQSLLQTGPPFSTSSPLYWFLCPQSTAKGFSGRESPHSTPFSASQKGLDVQLGTIESPFLQSPRSEVGSHKSELDHDKSSLVLGKTVKLNMKIHPNKNLKQLLSAQHHSCAGCYKHLDVERGLVQGFVQTLGWGKPRLCEYSGQLYCASCHLNETAVLPAQVLWHWDFTPRRVSQLAKAYLDSIYDQPMLCVSAVNPYLYSRVPTLSHVKETRRKLSKMLSCMVCPSRTRIFQTMASRWYLLENNDFFALRDLEDVSKGAFAVLPGLLTAVMESLRLHITKQCSVCPETGEWCGAGILCEEPFSPIFPFQEENITSCKVCHAPFHKACFSRYTSCPACPKDQSKRSVLAGEFEDIQTEELADDNRNAIPLLDGQDVLASSSLAGVTDLQGQVNPDELSHSHRNWPSFHSLLPKKRFW